jgi:MinD superfamily P-loop ATPase
MNKIITVWGNPNSGKTLFSVKLAKKLSKDKNVILVFTDIFTPPLEVVLPFENTHDKSIGKLLEVPILTQEDILKELVISKKNKNLAFLGFKQGENYTSYAKYNTDRANDLIINLSYLADYIIIDTYSALQSDRLTRSALKLADITFRLCTSNLKAISFFKSVMPLMIEKSFNLEKQIKVLSKSKENSPKAIIKNHYGEIKYNLPFTSELESQYEEGFLFEKLTLKESKEYVENFNEIIHLITGEEIVTNKKNRKLKVSKKNVEKNKVNNEEKINKKNDVSNKKMKEKSHFKLPKLPKIKLRKKKEGFDE